MSNISNPFEVILNELAEIRADIQKLRKPVELKPEPEPDKILIDEVQRITGLKRATIYQLTSTGALAHKRQGKILVFSRKEVLMFLESKTYSKPDRKQNAAKLLAASANKKMKKPA